MDLTRTERLLLETAAELFEIGMSPAEAAVMADFELTPDEQSRVNGCRPQLGDLLLGRGLLTEAQLDEAFERVFEELRGWSDSLAPPEPTPVPRPAPEPTGDTAQLAELVKQLTGLLDVLVGAAPPEGRVRAAPAAPAAPGAKLATQLPARAPKTQAELNLGENLLGIDPRTVYGDDEDEDDEDTAKLAAGEAGDEQDEDTRDEPPPDAAGPGETLQVERPRPRPTLGQPSGDTLSVERPASQGA